MCFDHRTTALAALLVRPVCVSFKIHPIPTSARITPILFKTFLFALTLVARRRMLKAQYLGHSILDIFIRDGMWAYGVIFGKLWYCITFRLWLKYAPLAVQTMCLLFNMLISKGNRNALLDPSSIELILSDPLAASIPPMFSDTNYRAIAGSWCVYCGPNKS